MNPTQEAELRALGASLADHVRQANGRPTTPTARQALVADLCGERDDLVIPLKDVVSRRSFESFLQAGDPRVGSAVQRDVLLSELQQIYSPVVVERIAAVLNGFLDLVPTAHTPSAAASSGRADAPQPEPSVGSRDKSVEAAMPSRVGPPAPPKPQIWLLLLPLTGLLVAVLALFSLRNFQFCQLTGTCSTSPSLSRGDSALAAALAAAEKLKSSTGLDEYQRALNDLETELKRIPDQALNSDQQQEVDALADTARQGRRRLDDEKGYQQALRSAESSLDRAQAANGMEREEALKIASTSLAGIPSNSFSAVEAAALKIKLEGMLLSKRSEVQQREPMPPPIEAKPSEPVQSIRRSDGSDNRAPTRAPAPVAPPPVPPAPPAPAAPSVVPRPPAPQRREEPARPAAGSSQYRLPKAWEERRERRREIMDNYSSDNAE
jgi:hypothetical protein